MTIRGFRIARRAGLVASVGVLLAMLASPADAAFIQINSDGTTERFSGPVIATADGIKPIAEEVTPMCSRAAALPSPPISGAIGSAAGRVQLSGKLIEAVAWAESRFNQRARSPKGAEGVMQLMPATSRDLGVNADDLPQNIDGGARYLSLLLRNYDGDVVLALSAYNAGPGAVARYDGEPPFAETRAFVDAVLDRLADVSGNSPFPSETLP